MEIMPRSLINLQAGVHVESMGILTPELVASGIRLLCMPVAMRAWIQAGQGDPPSNSLQVAVIRTPEAYLPWMDELRQSGRFAIPDMQDPATVGVLLHYYGSLVADPQEDPLAVGAQALSVVYAQLPVGVVTSAGHIVSEMLQAAAVHAVASRVQAEA